jgi:RNA polymerase sigma-70 factor, ECF subfamily
VEKEIQEMHLVEMVRSGDQSAFLEIVKRYEAKIASTVYGMLGQTQDAEDVGQEVFIRFYRSIGQFRGESKLVTYLTKIAINLSLNVIKKNRLRRFLSFEEWSKKERASQGDNSNIEQLERDEIVRKALACLDAKHRSVIILRLINGYSTEETADILGLPAGTVLSRLFRAQEKLKAILASKEVEI